MDFLDVREVDIESRLPFALDWEGRGGETFLAPRPGVDLRLLAGGAVAGALAVVDFRDVVDLVNEVRFGVLFAARPLFVTARGVDASRSLSGLAPADFLGLRAATPADLLGDRDEVSAGSKGDRKRGVPSLWTLCVFLLRGLGEAF